MLARLGSAGRVLARLGSAGRVLACLRSAGRVLARLGYSPPAIPGRIRRIPVRVFLVLLSTERGGAALWSAGVPVGPDAVLCTAHPLLYDLVPPASPLRRRVLRCLLSSCRRRPWVPQGGDACDRAAASARRRR